MEGEILVSRATDKFDWGCNHRVRRMAHVNGEYKILGTYCTLKETYAQLDIDGDMKMGYEEAYYVLPDPEVEKEGDLIEASRTRADDDSGESLVSFTDEGLIVNFPLTAGFDVSTPSGFSFSIGVEGKETVTLDLNFDDFSLSNMVFMMTKTVEESYDISIGGSYTYSNSKKNKRLLRTWHPVKAKAVTIGPLLLVLSLDISLSFSVSVSASLDISSYKKTIYTYTFDLERMKCTKKEHVVQDDPLHFSGSFGGRAGFSLDFIFAIGIYGKVLSVKIIPSIWVGVEASLAKLKQMQWRLYGSDITCYPVDLSDAPSIEAPKVEISLTLAVTLDLTMDDWFGSSSTYRTLEEKEEWLQRMRDIADKNSDYYQKIKNDANISDEDKDALLDDDHEEYGASVTLGPWTIESLTFEWKWFPEMSSEISIYRTANQFTGDMMFLASYTVGKLGLLVNIVGQEYVPALVITDGDKYVGTLFANHHGLETIVKYRQYMFYLNDLDLKENHVYKAYPCYYSKEDIESFGFDQSYPGPPVAIDKGMEFCTTTPSAVISKVETYGFEKEFDENHQFGPRKDQYYRYTYKIYTYSKLDGATNIESWGVRERLSKTDKVFDGTNAAIKGDGTYRMKWKFHQYTGLITEADYCDVRLISFFTPFEDDSDKIQIEREAGSEYHLRFFTDNSYLLYIDRELTTVGKSLDSRLRGESDSDDDLEVDDIEDDNIENDNVEVELEAIETLDGRVIWARPGYDPEEDAREQVQPLRLRTQI